MAILPNPGDTPTLAQFSRLYYSRNKLTIGDNFRRALLFMDTQLADNILAAWTKDKTIDNFLSGSAREQEVKVNRIDIEDLRAAPYKASVEYELIYKSPFDGSEIKTLSVHRSLRVRLPRQREQ